MKSERWPQAVMAPEPNGGPLESATKAIVDLDGSAWDKRTDEIVAKYTCVIGLRGAGSNNGIDKEAADRLLTTHLIPRIQSKLQSGAVAIIFDGDNDDIAKPDVGYVAGRLRDAFSSEPRDKITFLTAQKKSWYYPTSPESNLANAHGLGYETFVFDDGKFAGDHNSFTQSEKLVNFAGYEQWYIGASGTIAEQQLEDYSAKVTMGRKQKVIFFRAPLNEKIAGELQERLTQATTTQDGAKIDRIKGILQQRENKYGVHWDNDGNTLIDLTRYENLDFEFVRP